MNTATLSAGLTHGPVDPPRRISEAGSLDGANPERSEEAALRRSEEALRISEERYRTLFEKMDEGFCVIEMIDGPAAQTVDYRFVEINPMFEQHTGLRQALGRTIRELVPEHAAHWFEIYGRVARTGEAIRFEYPANAMRRHFDVFAFRIGGESGPKVGVLFKDITERKLAEEEIRSLNATLEQRIAERTRELRTANTALTDIKAALDAHAIVATTDPQGKITYVNDTFCAISKYTREELLGQDHRIINSAHHSAEFMRDLWQTIGRGRVWRGEIKNRAKDGSFYWLDTTIVAVQNDKGKPAQYITIRTDITESRRAADEIKELNLKLQERATQLEAANRELEAFAYTVSHDLRAPVRGIDNFARIAVEVYGPRLDDEGRRLLGVVSGESRRMGRLIDDLLAFSRIGRQSMAAAAVDMAALAREEFDRLARTSGGRAPSLVLGALPANHGDPAMLRQVWANLLGNAVKFTRGRPAPLIEISGTTAEGVCTYCVKDNGAGFDPRHAPKLFGVFQRLHAEEEFEGTGVGLALVQRIVQRHGGRVWGYGQVNTGATFFFTLPERDGVPS